MKLLSRLFLGLVAVLAAAASIRAQDFPAGRITVVVAFSAGGPVDVVARVLADRLAQRWSVPVTVENRTGAGGNIAAAIVAKAADCATARGVGASSIMAAPMTRTEIRSGFGILILPMAELEVDPFDALVGLQRRAGWRP